MHQVLSGSPRGLQIFRLMETGELVPAIIVLHLLTEAMVEVLLTIGNDDHRVFFRLKRSMEAKQKGFCLMPFHVTWIRLEISQQLHMINLDESAANVQRSKKMTEKISRFYEKS